MKGITTTLDDLPAVIDRLITTINEGVFDQQNLRSNRVTALSEDPRLCRNLFSAASHGRSVGPVMRVNLPRR
jgi:hypothetical protein